MEDPEAFAKGIGLIVFGALWALTGNVVASALAGFGAYLVAKGLRGWKGS